MELLAGNCRKRMYGTYSSRSPRELKERRRFGYAGRLGVASSETRTHQAAGDRCFEAILWDDVEESGQLTRGFAKGELEMEIQGRVSRDGTSWDVVSLSSSVDRDEHSSPPGTLGEAAGERIHREEAWRQQEIERIKETRKQEMPRSSSLISFIKSVIGEEI
ncbi:BnaC09g20340D [Brassica napus]|uniref:(rape) hypothetical protein n=1 Tax=Brassica napus TaxID=3708 RepID=A0A078GMV1_BRANA|nr:unnamed protein product [Brassica napus]CDY25953.1 BnaC09g20340D [Brassica napus]